MTHNSLQKIVKLQGIGEGQAGWDTIFKFRMKLHTSQYFCIFMIEQKTDNSHVK